MEQLTVIRTKVEVRALMDKLRGSDYIAFDTETTGLHRDCEVIGFSVCADPEHGYYVILSEWNVKTQKLEYLETKELATEFMAFLKDFNLIMQNAIFDCRVVSRNFNVELMPSVHTDTLLLGHLLNENRPNGLKERGYELFGDDAVAEAISMRKSIVANGGKITKTEYELYKANSELIAYYGAKDAILTLKVFYNDVPKLFEEKLDTFFYDEETMPLLREVVYGLNTYGLKIDTDRLQTLKKELEAEILEKNAFISTEIASYVKDKYKGTSKATTFNINSPEQLAWLLFERLGNDFFLLTDEGRVVCKSLGLKLPYSASERRNFVHQCRVNKGAEYVPACHNKKTGKITKAKKIKDYWKYLARGKKTLEKFKDKYNWVGALLQLRKAEKLLGTYVLGIEGKMHYGVIYPEFLMHGTRGCRLSSRSPNFQNLPRDDQRVKHCIIAREGKLLVALDYEQIEPRVFASYSKDPNLCECFEKGDDFYSVVGAPIFEVSVPSFKKSDPEGFAKKYSHLRDIAKSNIVLAAPYGTTAANMAQAIGKTKQECQGYIDSYFEKFPKVYEAMLDAYEEAKRTGVTYNLFGRPRRIPEAMLIPKLFGETPHGELEYKWRTLLNLAFNSKIQNTAAGIINRASISLSRALREHGLDGRARIILQVHDELVLEADADIISDVAKLAKECMENTVKLPGVKLVAEPKIGRSLKETK